MVRLHCYFIPDLLDFHGRTALEKLRQHAPVFRIKMLDNREGQPGIGRHVAEEDLHGLQPSGGRADSYDRDGFRGWFTAG
jgi:hypothetical protein